MAVFRFVTGACSNLDRGKRLDLLKEALPDRGVIGRDRSVEFRHRVMRVGQHVEELLDLALEVSGANIGQQLVNDGVERLAIRISCDANFRQLLDSLFGVIWVTPHIQHPRCEYLRDR